MRNRNRQENANVVQRGSGGRSLRRDPRDYSRQLLPHLKDRVGQSGSQQGGSGFKSIYGRHPEDRRGQKRPSKSPSYWSPPEVKSRKEVPEGETFSSSPSST